MKSKILFKIYGTVVEKETRKPLPNLTVKAIDKDLLFDDLLGSAITDNRGYFEIKYDNKDFQELVFDQKPDIFLKISNAEREVIHTTRHQVRFEANRIEKFVVEVPQSSLHAKSAVEVALKHGEIGEVVHPGGLRLQTAADALACDSVVTVMSLGPAVQAGYVLAELGNGFLIRSTAGSTKPISLSVAAEADDMQQLVAEGHRFFFEIREEDFLRVIAGHLREKSVKGANSFFVETHFELPEHQTVSVAAGVFMPVTPSNAAFHPAHHQFKISPLDQADDGACRREGSEFNESTEDCRPPAPVTLYPACFPAAWARLYGAYRLVLPPARRRWEIGTPQCPNPPPDENGDYFSTWAMATDEIGDPPPAMRVEDWHSGESITVDPVPPIKFEFRNLDAVNEDDIRERADQIKGALVRLVGKRGLAEGQPVYISHSGHAWNIVGVEETGYWSHGQNPESQGLSDWCTWENAPWLVTELDLLRSTDDHIKPHQSFDIRFPQRCGLKSRRVRLGSITMSGSGGRANNVQFVDLSSGKSIDWTPHLSASSADAGYVWIEDGSALENSGIPKDRDANFWGDELGFRVPMPINEFGHCRCHSPDGCPRCRTRLQLPFWVHNTTKDERHTYRVDLYFWTSDGRWVKKRAEVMETYWSGYHPRYPDPDWYDLPATIPRPGQAFKIEATPDTHGGPGDRPHPWNCQPVAWCVDFYKGELCHVTTPEVPVLHGIKLVLICIDTEPEVSCKVQDIKQLWFESQGEPMI